MLYCLFIILYCLTLLQCHPFVVAYGTDCMSVFVIGLRAGIDNGPDNGCLYML